MSTKALLLAAGYGQRLNPFTKVLPKCLMPINKKPILEFWIEKLISCGIEHILINVHHFPKDIINFLEKAERNSYDTIFCFGVLYYITEPYRLLKLMVRAAKKSIIIDTFTASYSAVQGKDAPKTQPELTSQVLSLPLMISCPTQTNKKDYDLPEYFCRKGRNLSLTSLPTEAMLELWFESLGLTWEQLDWSRHITRACSFQDLLTPEQKMASHWADIYASGIRVSYKLHI